MPTIAVTQQEVVIEVEGVPGPRGLQGNDGASPAAVTVTAPTDMSAHRIVANCPSSGQIEYADHTDVAQAGNVLGMTLTAASAGTPIDISLGGEVNEPSWSWNVGLIFLGQNGQMTQTAPATGYLQPVATALSATKIVVRILEPFLL